jgi:hypothetical protein
MPRRHYSRTTSPSVRTTWAKVAVKVLSDGKWHDIDELRGEMEPLIPATKALATFDANWMPRFFPQPKKGRTAQGRRYIAVHTLGNLRKEYAVEKKGRKYRALWPAR